MMNEKDFFIYICYITSILMAITGILVNKIFEFFILAWLLMLFARITQLEYKVSDIKKHLNNFNSNKIEKE